MVLLFALLFSFQIGTSSAAVSDTSSTYHKGKQLVQEGFVREGLDVWLTEWNNLQDDPTYIMDPRIGFEFVEAAVVNNMTPTFRLASYMYMEAIKSPKFPDYVDSLRSHLIPVTYLLDRADAKKMDMLIESDPVGLSVFLLETWEKLDANPMTLVNESLLEFYVRKLEAKRIFTETNTLDERPNIHIRYGAPLQKRRGTYRPSQGNIRNLIEDFFVNKGIDGPDLYYRWLQQALVAFSFDFEIWVYYDQEIMFVRNEQTNGFAETVLDLVLPPRFYQRPNVQGVLWEVPKITPAMFIIYDMYAFMASKAQFLAEGFVEVESRTSQAFVGAVRTDLRNEAMGIKARSLGLDRLNRFSRPPNNVREKNTFKLDIESKQHHFFRPDQDSIIVLNLFYAQASKGDSTFKPGDMPGFNNLSIPNAELRSIEVRDDNDFPLPFETPLLSVGEEKKWQNRIFAGSQAITYAPSDSVYPLATTVSASVPYVRQEGVADTTKLFLAAGQGVSQPKQIQAFPKTLALSDILIGYNPIDQKWNKNELFGFYVPRDGDIPSASNILFYSEVYGLTENVENGSEYTLQVQIKSDRFFLFRGRPKASIQLNMVADGSWDRQELELETSQLDAGEYRLYLTITDKATKTVVKKDVPFVILPPKYDVVSSPDL